MLSNEDLELLTHKAGVKNYSIHICESSDEYQVASYRGGLILAFIALIQIVLLQVLGFVWVPYPLLVVLSSVVVFFIVGFMLVYRSTGLKAYLSADRQMKAVRSRAAEYFIENKINKSLLFMSLLEKKCQIIRTTGFDDALTDKLNHMLSTANGSIQELSLILVEHLND